MNKEEFIREKLLDILADRFKVNMDKKEGIYDLNLLGKSIKMTPSDLIGLFLDIEKQFNITFSEEDIIKGRFKTINSITQVICEKSA